MLETRIASIPPCEAALPGLSRAVLAISLAPAPAQVDARILAACLYDPFRSTGDAALAEAARASDVLNRTLPPGHLHSAAGLLAASQQMRTASPDIRYATVI